MARKQKIQKKEERKEKTCHEKKATIIRANRDIFDYNFLLHRMCFSSTFLEEIIKFPSSNTFQ